MVLAEAHRRHSCLAPHMLMRAPVVRAQQLGQWVGSAVIHLGDHNVPNALLFIDKYTQARRPTPGAQAALLSIAGHCRTAVTQCCSPPSLLRGWRVAAQVPRILNPVVLVVDALPELCREPKLNAYVCSLYGSAEGARCGLLGRPSCRRWLLWCMCVLDVSLAGKAHLCSQLVRCLP